MTTGKTIALTVWTSVGKVMSLLFKILSSWCSGKTWRERVEREVGGGIRMGKTCKLKAVSFQCMTKFTTNLKKKKRAKKKIYCLGLSSLFFQGPRVF